MRCPWTRIGFRHLGHRPFPRSPPGSYRLGLGRGPVGHAMKPVADHLPRRHRGGFAGEDQERRLKGILRVIVVAQGAATDAPHHGSVPHDKSLERRPIPRREKPFEQLPVGEPADHPGLEKCLEVSARRTCQTGLRHLSAPPRRPLRSMKYCRDGLRSLRDFLCGRGTTTDERLMSRRGDGLRRELSGAKDPAESGDPKFANVMARTDAPRTYYSCWSLLARA